MNDTQILTLAISIVIPVSLLLYSNSRITDVKDAVNKRIDDTNNTLNNQIKSLEANMNKRIDLMEKNLSDKIDNAFQHIEMLLKLHEIEHHGDKK